MEAHDCHYGTPLHVACARQHYDCAKVLLNAGEFMVVVGYNIFGSKVDMDNLIFYFGCTFMYYLFQGSNNLEDQIRLGTLDYFGTDLINQQKWLINHEMI